MLSGRERPCGHVLSSEHHPLAHYGGRSSVGRAPDCDSGRRGFESHQSPQISLDFIRGIFFAYFLLKPIGLRATLSSVYYLFIPTFKKTLSFNT